jgi:hypothetical protein
MVINYNDKVKIVKGLGNMVGKIGKVVGIDKSNEWGNDGKSITRYRLEGEGLRGATRKDSNGKQVMIPNSVYVYDDMVIEVKM